MTLLLGIFIIELLSIFFLSRMVTRTFGTLFFHLTKKEHYAVNSLAFLFFPGTLIHELAHFFMAIILFVRVGEMEFVPKVSGGSVKLGSVAIGKTDPLRRALIGLAPLFFGLTILFSAAYYFSALPLTPWYINIVLVVFLVFEIANTMFSSRRDVEGLPVVLFLLAAVMVALYFLGVSLPQGLMDFVSSTQHVKFIQQLDMYMIVPIVLDGMIVGVARIFGKSY